MPAVSVLMPAYNVAPYLEESIESVLAQTFGDWELLIVDDGSTDGTARSPTRYALARPAHPAGSPGQRRPFGRPEYRHPPRAGQFSPCSTATTSGSPEFLASQLDVFGGGPWRCGHGQRLERGGPPRRPARAPAPRHAARPSLATSSPTTEAVFIFSVFHRDVVEAAWRLRRVACGPTRITTTGCAPRSRDFAFARNDRPLGQYRRRTDSLSASDVRMLRGILQVYRKLRPAVAGSCRRTRDPRPPDRPLRNRADRLPKPAPRFEAGDSRDGGRQAGRCCSRDGPRWRVAFAALLARWAPGLLASVYRRQAQPDCTRDREQPCEVHRRDRDVQPGAGPARHARKPVDAAAGRPLGSDRRRQQFERRHARRGRIGRAGTFRRHSTISSRPSRGAARR